MTRRSERTMSSLNPLAVNKLFELSETEVKQYVSWKNSKACGELLTWLKRQIEQTEAGNHPHLVTLNQPSSKGLVVYTNALEIDASEWLNLSIYLRDRTLELGYGLYLSQELANPSKKIIRHFLKAKPILSNSGLYNQFYGNITIELLYLENRLKQLKILCNSYVDKQYELVWEYEDYLERLLLI